MQSIRPKDLFVFLLAVAASLIIAIGPGRHLLSFAYHTGDQSYILLVPVLAAMLVYRDQDSIFRKVSSGISTPTVVAFVIGLALIGSAYGLTAGSEWQMVAAGLGLVACWVGAFILCFGPRSARAATFPLAMLLWVVPIPTPIVESFRYFLQVGSADLVNVLFGLTGIPVLREGLFIFHLPTQSIEVAKECSGIRSSLCLILLTLVIAHESLRGNFRRFWLLLSTVPIVILKNGVRIVTLTLGAIYINPSFLTGSLHHDGGIVFFLIGLLMLIPVLALLRRGDSPVKAKAANPAVPVQNVAAGS
jgi:exosortase